MRSQIKKWVKRSCKLEERAAAAAAAAVGWLGLMQEWGTEEVTLEKGTVVGDSHSAGELSGFLQ